MGVYTPEQIAELEARGACPYWQTLNPLGWCVEKWWAGGPFARGLDALSVVVGMAVLGAIVAEATKYRPFKAAFDKFEASKDRASFLKNGPGRRARRRRLRRR